MAVEIRSWRSSGRGVDALPVPVRVPEFSGLTRTLTWPPVAGLRVRPAPPEPSYVAGAADELDCAHHVLVKAYAGTSRRVGRWPLPRTGSTFTSDARAKPNAEAKRRRHRGAESSLADQAWARADRNTGLGRRCAGIGARTDRARARARRSRRRSLRLAWPVAQTNGTVRRSGLAKRVPRCRARRAIFPGVGGADRDMRSHSSRLGGDGGCGLWKCARRSDPGAVAFGPRPIATTGVYRPRLHAASNGGKAVQLSTGSDPYDTRREPASARRPRTADV